MAHEMSVNLLHLLHTKCRCKCHAAVISGVENSGTEGCTETQCQCGKIIFSNSSNASSHGFGRMDHSTVFRPIIPSDSGSQQLQGSQEVLSNSFNILSLQNIRTDSLDARNSIPPPPHRQSADYSSGSSFLSDQGSSSKSLGTFMTPQDFLNSSNSKSIHATATVHGAKSIFPDVALPGTSDFNRDRAASRSTPLTVEDVSSRFISPDEFLMSSQRTTEIRSCQSTPTVACEQNFMGQDANLSEFNGITDGRNKSNLSTMKHNEFPMQEPRFMGLIANGKKNETPDNPLSEFCSKIGVTADHNPLLPTIPGGDNIRERLRTPSPSKVESLKRDLNKEAGEIPANGDEETPVNKPEVPLKDMPYRNSGGTKPYIAIFWDIENCHVPRKKDANSIVRLVRDKFCGQHIEYEFYVVMDVHKEKEELSKELQRAQVTVVHVSKGEKNAADEKLMYLMRRYAAYHQYGHTCILISGDTNFTPVLHDMRHKHHINIILLHNNNTNEQLRNTAHFTYNFSFVTDDAPTRQQPHPSTQYQPTRPQREEDTTIVSTGISTPRSNV